MQMIKVAVPMLAMSFLLLGCEKHPVETTNPSPPAAVSPPAAPSATSAPTVDTSLPPVQPAAVPTPKTGTDSTTGSTLTQTERDSKMPLPGQVNDHSNPEPAKKGDSTAPAKSPK